MHRLRSRRLSPVSLAVLVVSGLLAFSPSASAVDLTAFITKPLPSENWSTGYGAAMSSGIAGILTFEGELAHLPVATSDGALTSFTASALVSPPIGHFAPYGGIGFGLFRQTLGNASDTGRIHALIVGVKWRFGEIGVARADYREFDLSGDPLVRLDRRLSLAVGLSF